MVATPKRCGKDDRALDHPYSEKNVSSKFFFESLKKIFQLLISESVLVKG